MTRHEPPTFDATERRAASRRAWMRAPLAAAAAHACRVMPRRRREIDRMAVHATPTSKSATLAAAVALDVSTWTYAWDDPRVRHLGPMSQDFAAAFGLGSSDRRIDMVDYCGVLLTCVQVLHDRILALEAVSASPASEPVREEVNS